MIPIRVDGPAVEPVTMPEMRAYLRLDTEDEDALIAALIRSARLTVEAAARLILVETRFRLRLDRWPRSGVLCLGVGPLLAVEQVAVLDRAGASEALDPALYEVEASTDPPRLLVAPAAPAPGRRRHGIEVVLTAGHGPAAADVPEPLCQAVRLLVAHWFEHRGDEPHPWPAEIGALVAPFRRVRL